MVSAPLSNMPTQPPVVVRDLHKSYGRGAAMTPVLEGVDLIIDRGQCAFLVGPSGSGKTTLLSILGCILTSDQGSVRVLGHDLTRLDNHERTLLRRDRIGFVFQRFHLIRGLTALENVYVPLTLCGVSRQVAARRATELLDAVGLGGKAGSHPRNLSAGQCQRVALARALAVNPELILADEPTAALDATNGAEVMKLLRQLTAAEGRTAVVVTHDTRIFDFADKIFHLDNGRITETREKPGTACSP